MLLVDYIVGGTRRYLRDILHQSFYESAQWSGLRVEVIKRIERGDGSLASFNMYISAFCREYRDVATRLFHELSLNVAQSNINY